MEDTWWCPACNKEHRTHDGTMMGQVHKGWREATKEENALIEDGADPCVKQELYRDGYRYIDGRSEI